MPSVCPELEKNYDAITSGSKPFFLLSWLHFAPQQQTLRSCFVVIGVHDIAQCYGTGEIHMDKT